MDRQGVSVTSHVARDLLQNAAYFNTLPKVVWEYVSNSLDNGKDGAPVTVIVDLVGTKLQITDNGSGMSRSDLKRFFQMHGVNAARASGKKVRGRFGTGKSAAFGVANSLTIDTVQGGKRNQVRLTRSLIESARHGNAFPVEEIIVDEEVDASEREDGTLVQIEDFLNPRLNLEQTIQYVEKHLARYRTRATVIINSHTCKFQEPVFLQEFVRTPSDRVAQHIGNVELHIRVSPTPLDKDFNGVDILSYGIWHETTLAGLENKEQVNKIFGEVEVPALEDYKGPVPTFDNTRNNQLNRSNPIVIILLGWITEETEKVRQALVKEEQERRKSEEFKRLENRSKEIERILNEDFIGILDQYELARKIKARNSIMISTSSGENGESISGEGQQTTSWQAAGHSRGDGRQGSYPPGIGEQPRPGGPSLVEGNQVGGPQKIDKEVVAKKQRGIFSIEWVNNSSIKKRSEYQPDLRTIFINLDHPQVASALKAGGGSVESRQFKEMVYEIAAVEYALAVQYERAGQEDLDPFEALFEIHDIIDRISRRFSTALTG